MLVIRFADLSDKQKKVFEKIVLKKGCQIIPLLDKISDDAVLYPIFQKKGLLVKNKSFSDNLYLLEIHEFAGFDIKNGVGPLQTIMPDDVMVIDFDRPESSKVFDICAFYNRFTDFDVYDKQREY